VTLSLSELFQEVNDFQIPLPDSYIMIVDDDEAMRDVLVKWITRQGMPVITAESGEQALEKLQAADPLPRVAFVDKNLPGIDGIEVISQGKEHAPDTEFIVITGYASTKSVIDAMDAGAFGYIAKPFPRLEVLNARLYAALEKNLAVHQNTMLLTRLRETYKELYDTKVEVEMLDDLVASKVEQHRAGCRGLVAELESGLGGLQQHFGSLVSVLSDAAADGLSAEQTTAELQRALGLSGLVDRIVALQQKLKVAVAPPSEA